MASVGQRGAAAPRIYMPPDQARKRMVKQQAREKCIQTSCESEFDIQFALKV